MEDVFGCNHYKRKCLIITECCRRTYPCRFCHDENEDHKINRHKTKYMLCLLCGLVQDVSNKCVKCESAMGEYFCSVCKFWTSKKDTFHCHKCGICRSGDKDSYFHCNDCGACMHKSALNNHAHVENTLKSNCPICAEYMFTSTMSIMLLKCGHAIHEECFNYYLKGSVQCPICLKSTGHTKVYNDKIDYILESNAELQQEDVRWKCELSCYDCQGISKITYRFLYNKCTLCDSYNTRVGDVYRE